MMVIVMQRFEACSIPVVAIICHGQLWTNVYDLPVQEKDSAVVPHAPTETKRVALCILRTAYSHALSTA